MADMQNGQSLEAALLAEEREIENSPEENPTDRDVHAFGGFGSDGVTPTRLDGEEYAKMD